MSRSKTDLKKLRKMHLDSEYPVFLVEHENLNNENWFKSGVNHRRNQEARNEPVDTTIINQSKVGNGFQSKPKL